MGARAYFTDHLNEYVESVREEADDSQFSAGMAVFLDASMILLPVVTMWSIYASTLHGYNTLLVIPILWGLVFACLVTLTEPLREMWESYKHQ